MKHFKNIKNKIKWEQYYNPDFDWDDIQFYENFTFSEEFLNEFQDKVNLHLLITRQQIPENILYNFQLKFSKGNWLMISRYQKLSENFIREFKDKVNWEYISKYQTLSEDFKKELFQSYKEKFKKNCVLYETF